MLLGTLAATILESALTAKGLPSIAYKFFNKITSGGTVKNKIISNKQLADKLHKPIIRKFEEKKYTQSFIDNIWGAEICS